MRYGGLALALAACTGGDKGGGTGDSAGEGTGELPTASVVVSGIVLESFTSYTVLTGFTPGLEAPDTRTTGTMPVTDACELSANTSSPTMGTGTTDMTMTMASLDPGEVTVELDGGAVALEPNGTGELESWPAGQSLSFSATGSDELPAFDAPDLFTVVGALAPATATSAGPNVYDVTWSGSGDPGAYVIIAAFGSAGMLFCPAADDGSFQLDVTDIAPADPDVLLERIGYTEEVVNGVQVLAAAVIDAPLTLD